MARTGQNEPRLESGTSLFGLDVAAARAAGIPVIAMGYGYTPVPVEELKADRLRQFQVVRTQPPGPGVQGTKGQSLPITTRSAPT